MKIYDGKTSQKKKYIYNSVMRQNLYFMDLTIKNCENSENSPDFLYEKKNRLSMKFFSNYLNPLKPFQFFSIISNPLKSI